MVVGMKTVLAGFTLALLLSALGSVALANGGDDPDATADKPDNDPGITALHGAIDEMRDARVAFRTECPNMGDAKCRAEFKKIRDTFKDAREKAIAKQELYAAAMSSSGLVTPPASSAARLGNETS